VDLAALLEFQLAETPARISATIPVTILPRSIASE